MTTSPQGTEQPPLTDEELASMRVTLASQLREGGYNYATAVALSRALAEVDRLRAELAETRKELAELTADHLGHIERTTKAAVDRADALAAKLAAVGTPVPDLILTPDGFEYEGQLMAVTTLSTKDRGTEQAEAEIRMVAAVEWQRRRKAAGLPTALGEDGGTE